MHIGKLGSGSALTPDTYNGARKTRHIIVDRVYEAVEAFRKYASDDICVLEVDCWNHLRNVWLEGMTKAIFTLAENTLREELYGIKSRLRVLASTKSVLLG